MGVASRIRSYRALAGLIGTTLIVIGMLGLGLDAYWAPVAVRFLTGLSPGNDYIALVPLTPIVVMAVGAYLVFLSKPRPPRADDKKPQDRQ